MRDSWSRYLKLRKLRASDLATVKAFDVIRAKAKTENKSSREFYDIGAEEHFERSIYLDEISNVHSQAICSEARRLGIPIPGSEDMWYDSSMTGGRFLSDKGFSELRSAIRKEKNERWSYWELRLKFVAGLLTALTGVAGALIGLASVLGLRLQ